ncbi:MAG TPA: hypothetical protein VHY22_00490 [Chthoniobacteraceae bacterium]|nr:hypothetical protein [Chthoniobacteraceae bacterium]
MIQANCRDRFTAEDFTFIVKTLGKSREDSISLTELLTDQEMRDSILDHELLFQAILSSTAQLCISPQLYFYVLTRHVFKESGLRDRRLCDYIASLLEAFSRTARLKSPASTDGSPIQYLSDMMLALRNASPVQTYLIRAHAGNYSLFLSGIFPSTVQRRSERGAPDVSFYEDMGRMNYKVVAGHTYARAAELQDIYNALAEQFRDVRLALNRLSDSLLNIDDASHIPLLA